MSATRSNCSRTIKEYSRSDDVRRLAIFSPTKEHRYELRRLWDKTKPPFYAGMLNPSKADAFRDDPTITRVWRRAAQLGYGELVVWNLGAGRATDPNDWQAMTDPIGPENDRYIVKLLAECKERNGLTMVGWGTLGSYMGRDQVVVNVAREFRVRLHCLGQTANGQPKHPLHLAYAEPLRRYHAVVATS